MSAPITTAVTLQSMLTAIEASDLGPGVMSKVRERWTALNTAAGILQTADSENTDGYLQNAFLSSKSEEAQRAAQLADIVAKASSELDDLMSAGIEDIRESALSNLATATAGAKDAYKVALGRWDAYAPLLEDEGVAVPTLPGVKSHGKGNGSKESGGWRPFLSSITVNGEEISMGCRGFAELKSFVGYSASAGQLSNLVARLVGVDNLDTKDRVVPVEGVSFELTVNDTVYAVRIAGGTAPAKAPRGSKAPAKAPQSSMYAVRKA